MDKKQKERAILNMVYSQDRIDEIIDDENPDFKIRNKHQPNFFGVEITELYYSESQARLDNIPEYFDEILHDKRFRHRKDIEELAVQQFTVQSDGKPDQQIEGIIKELPSIPDYVGTVADIIIEKGARIQDYVQGLTHVNLIIYDKAHRLHTLPKLDFYKVFFTPSLKAALLESGFREIFFITLLGKNTDKWVYVPLKMLLLVSQLYMFDGVLQHHYHHLHVDTPKKELSLFACYLYKIGAKEIYILDIEGEFEVICGNYGVIITEDKGLIVRDHADYALPSIAKHVTNKDEVTLIDDTFINRINEFIQNNTFEGSLAYDVNIPILADFGAH